jgi:hypothetical protein
VTPEFDELASSRFVQPEFAFFGIGKKRFLLKFANVKTVFLCAFTVICPNKPENADISALDVRIGLENFAPDIVVFPVLAKYSTSDAVRLVGDEDGW